MQGICDFFKTDLNIPYNRTESNRNEQADIIEYLLRN